MGLSKNELITTQWVAFGFATASLLCSFLTLFLIYKIKAWNGYLLLITSMTFFQVLYDINYMLGVYPSFAACASWQFLHILGGLSVTIWTNIISYIVMYVVRRIKTFNIFASYKYFVVIAVIFPLIIAILQILVVKPVSSTDDDLPYSYCITTDSQLSRAVSDIYYWGRLISIIFNFLIFIYTSIRVERMALLQAPRQHSTGMSIQSASASGESKNSPIIPVMNQTQTLAVYSLVQRMKYYPLAQALCRSGAAWNEFDDYQYQSYGSKFMASICSPSTGILYFIIFLIMQPKAWDTLKCLVLNKSVNEEPSTPATLSLRHTHSQQLSAYTEEDLECIIAEYDAQRSNSLSVGSSSKSMSGKLTFENPIRQYSEDVL